MDIYFDYVNGRSSRTIVMWYLLNNRVYPYIIFNRSITNNSSTYDETITDTRNNANISFFIRYMMINVKMKGEKDVRTFTSLYRRDNGYKRVRNVYLQILLLLIDKGIIEIIRTTNKEMFSGYNNEVFRINSYNPKIKKVNLRDN